MTIGERIQSARKKAGYTQKQLAELCCVATGTIQQYELGKRRPNIDMLLLISQTLNVTSEFLLYGSVDEQTVYISYDTPNNVSEDRPYSYPGLEKKVSELGYMIIYGTNENPDGIELVSGDIFLRYPDGEKLYIKPSELDNLNDEVDDYLRFRLEELRRKKTE